MPDPVTPDPVAAGAPAPGELDAAAVRRVWGDIVVALGRKSKRVAAWAREATVRDVDGSVLTLTFRYPFHAQALSNEPELLLGAIYEAVGGQWEIRCEVAGERAATRPAPTTAPPGRPSEAGPAAAQPPGTPARRTGATSGRPAAVGSPDADWPETAPPGGTSAATDAAATGSAPPTGPAAAGRAVAAQARRPATAEREWAGEPPYGPDFDGSPRGGPKFEGFDPGDEPLDEVIDERTPRQSSEQQAMQLLQQELGAEKIGEIDAR